MGKRATLEDWQKHRPGKVGEITPAPDVPACALLEKSRVNTPKEAMQALGRLKAGQMNKTEARYAAHLEMLKAAGEILWWAFEPANLRIGDNCFLKIDFMILRNTGALESHDVKGYFTDDALVKMRAAAEKFPWPIVSVQWVKGEWKYRHF